MTAQRTITFSPPDVGDAEIAEVADALRSGWITTGPKTKQFERELAAFIGTPRVCCLNSATAALECTLRLLGIGPGDEVITSAYTYTASASPVCHVGATVVLCDTAKDSYEMDYDQLAQLITPRTKAIIPVDLGGVLCNYDRILEIVKQTSKTCGWKPANERQKAIGRIAVVADCAHGLGSVRNGKNAGQIADMTTFSFHAVKNFTTAEGGALTWLPGLFDDEETYHEVQLLSLHGQSKDALAKTQLGAWEYDIVFPGWKCNMTDMQAGLGLAQLKRYPGLLERRRELVSLYEQGLSKLDVSVIKHYGENFASSGHLMLVRLNNHSRAFRDRVIVLMAKAGVATNVHYKPLPLFTGYKALGFDIKDFPNALAQFENEITLPLHTLLSDDDVAYVCETLAEACDKATEEGLA